MLATCFSLPIGLGRVEIDRRNSILISSRKLKPLTKCFFSWPLHETLLRRVKKLAQQVKLVWPRYSKPFATGRQQGLDAQEGYFSSERTNAEQTVAYRTIMVSEEDWNSSKRELYGLKETLHAARLRLAVSENPNLTREYVQLFLKYTVFCHSLFESWKVVGYLESKVEKGEEKIEEFEGKLNALVEVNKEMKSQIKQLKVKFEEEKNFWESAAKELDLYGKSLEANLAEVKAEMIGLKVRQNVDKRRLNEAKEANEKLKIKASKYDSTVLQARNALDCFKYLDRLENLVREEEIDFEKVFSEVVSMRDALLSYEIQRINEIEKIKWEKVSRDVNTSTNEE